MYAALCFSLPQEDWRDWARCRKAWSRCSDVKRISYSCSLAASRAQLETWGPKIFSAFSTAPQSYSRATLASCTTFNHLILGFPLQSTQDSVTTIVIAVDLIQLTCRGIPSQVCWWFQVCTETGFKMWNNKQTWPSRTPAVFLGAAFRQFSATPSAQPPHEGSSCASGQR